MNLQFSSEVEDLKKYLKIQFLPQRKHISITNTNWLMLFREVIAVYSDNHTKPTNKLYGRNSFLLNAEIGGTL